MVILNYHSLCAGNYPNRMNGFGEIPVTVYLEDIFELNLEICEKAPYQMVKVKFNLNFLDKVKRPPINREKTICSDPNLDRLLIQF